MSHHSDEMSQSMKTFMQEVMKKQGLGPTNFYPDGKVDPSDEGEIKVGVTVKDRTVILAFGKEIAWIGFTPDQADEIARLLITRAIEARN